MTGSRRLRVGGGHVVRAGAIPERAGRGSTVYAAFVPGNRHCNDSSREVFRKAYERLLAQGVGRLFYVPGEHLFGDDGEGTVDSSHPTGLGFMRIADALEPVLAPLC